MGQGQNQFGSIGQEGGRAGGQEGSKAERQKGRKAGGQEVKVLKFKEQFDSERLVIVVLNTIPSCPPVLKLNFGQPPANPKFLFICTLVSFGLKLRSVTQTLSMIWILNL